MSSFLEFLPEAFLDAESAVRHYEGHLQGLGTKFWIELEAICSPIPQNPFLWRERTGGFRRVNFLGFPYYVAFFIRADRVLVAAVGHASQHPDYWKHRIN